MLWVSLGLLFVITTSLTGQQASSFCHCNITPSFCDFGCCCDTDCSSTISTACFNAQSNSYCPNPTFFARLGTGFLNPQGCLYFNSSTAILDQISLTSNQVTTLVNNQENFTRVATASASVRPGYQIGDILSLGGAAVTTFSVLDTTGNCLTAVTGTSSIFQLKFGVNMLLSCNSATVTGTPLIFSQLSGKTLFQFSGDTTTTVTIPTFASGTITSAELRIIIGYYGSDKARYIERVTVSTSTSATATEKSLNLRFIEPSQLQQTGSPSFFPQLPSDIFYPVYLLN